MAFRKGDLAAILGTLDLGSSVAEQDDLLEHARVETSVFTDLLADRVDLIPGTKGSGKSALYRIFVDFLPDFLLEQRKVVVAHGVQAHGDSVFHAFKERFEVLDEDDFVDFWCIYFVSLAHEHFIKGDRYAKLLAKHTAQIDGFRRSCHAARIPEIPAKKTLYQVLEWALNAVQKLRPKITLEPSPGSTIEVDLFGPRPAPPAADRDATPQLPRYVHQVRDDLEAILRSTHLQLWLMIDRLDEIFPRRSRMETLALRGLLRTARLFQSPAIRIKVFLRDDIIDQVTGSGDGFTALTHVTARQSDKLSWSEDQVLNLVVNRLFASQPLRRLLHVNPGKLKASQDYRTTAFYKVFPPTVHSGKNQSHTLHWIYTHTMDGRGVVTPRDVIDLLTRARQRQQDEFEADPEGETDVVIGSAAILYGLTDLSKRKRETYLKAEFPHFWPDIEKFQNRNTEYSEAAIHALLGANADRLIADLVGIGLLEEASRLRQKSYRIPFLYRDGLELTQGRTD